MADLNLRSLNYSGTIRAIQPLAHGGGKKSGTVHSFRRETLFNNEGQPVYSVPCISGGTIRHSLRTLGAKMTQDWLAPATGKLPYASVHALHNGGSLRETRSASEVLTGERQAVLRDLVPHIAIFGAVGGARAMSGRLDVHTAVPVAQETAFLQEFYGGVVPENPVSIYELVQRGRYGRFSSQDSSHYVEEEAKDGGPTNETNENDGKLRPGQKGNMIFWSQEVLPMGTRLFHSVYLRDATDVEVSFFQELMGTWSATATIGQQRRVGMGRIHPEYDLSVTDLSGRAAEVVPGDWRGALEGKQEQAREALLWL